MRFWFVALWAGLAGGAWAQTEKEYAEALGIWQKQSGSATPNERAECARRLGEATFKSKDLTTVQHIVGLINAELKNEGNGGKFEEKVSGQVLDECTGALKHITDDGAVEFLVKQAKNKAAAWRYRFYIIHAFGGLSGTKTMIAATEILDDTRDDPHVHIACVDSMVEKADKSTLGSLHKVVKDDTRPWEVRLGAVQAIRKIKDPSSIDALVDALTKIKDHEGRLKFEAIETLKKLTSIDLESPDPADWKAAIDAKKQGKDPAKDGGTGIVTVPTKFFGLKTKSTRIVFILDKSGSMEQPGSEPPDKEDPEKDKPKIGTDSGSKPKGPTDPGDPKRELLPHEVAAMDEAKKIYEEWKAKKGDKKIVVLKKQFIKTIYLMDWRVWFAIVWFDSNIQTWKDDMVQATWPNKLEAIKHVANLAPSGMTNTWDALETAFKIVSKPTPKDPGAAKVEKNAGYMKIINGPDTFYLMSDGIPNTGRVPTENGVLEELKKVNGVRKIVINAICIGDPPEVHPPFLEQMAKDNGGSFTHVKGK